MKHFFKWCGSFIGTADLSTVFMEAHECPWPKTQFIVTLDYLLCIFQAHKCAWPISDAVLKHFFKWCGSFIGMADLSAIFMKAHECAWPKTHFIVTVDYLPCIFQAHKCAWPISAEVLKHFFKWCGSFIGMADLSAVFMEAHECA